MVGTRGWGSRYGELVCNRDRVSVGENERVLLGCVDRCTAVFVKPLPSLGVSQNRV